MSNGYRTLSQHLNDLKKENFSLKLRIYFLEERIQQKYEESSEDVYRSVSPPPTHPPHPCKGPRAGVAESVLVRLQLALIACVCLLTQLSRGDGTWGVFVLLSLCCFFSGPEH